MWDISNTTTWIKGNHTFNIGANYRRWWLQRDLATDFTGNFGFGAGFNLTGSPVADFLLGYYTSASSFQPAGFSVPGQVGNPREMNFMYFAPYIQDDWKVSPKLTLNLGLRYDYRSVPYETNDHMGWRNLSYAPGGLLVADPTLQAEGINDGQYYQAAGRRNPENPDLYKVFAPRLGFAYRPDDEGKTVIRGGWGRFYDSAEGREIDGAADIYPYVSRGIYSQSVSQTTPYLTTDQLFPSFSEQGVATPAANTFLAVSMSPEPRNPYVDQWSLGIQRQLNRNTVAELNYVGSRGNNLLMRINVAQALPYTEANPTVAGRKPFPNFGVYIDSTWSGTSKYNALNAKIEHHGRSLLATFAYTWSKSTDSKSAAAGIGASGFNGWQGFLEQPRPGPRLRPFRLRRGPSRRRQLRVEPALRQGRALRGRRFRPEGSHHRRLADERHLHLAARVPAHDPGRRRRERLRQLRHQPGERHRAIPTGRRNRRGVLQHECHEPAGARPVRQLHAQLPARAHHQQPGLRALQELRPSERIAPAVPVRVVQRLQPPELQRAWRRTSRTRPSAASPRLVPDASTSSG